MRDKLYDTELSDAAWASISDQRAGTRLLGGLRPVFPLIRTVMADAGHQSRKLARALKRHEGWKLIITKRGQRAFKIRGRPGSWSVALPGSGATSG